MKLYYAKFPHSSLPVHIVLEELGLAYEAILVDLTIGRPKELLQLNPVGGVPVLISSSGESFTEVPMILQYLADLKPDLNLIPPWGSMDRYRVQEWLNFLATEIHKGFWPFGFLSELSDWPPASSRLVQALTQNIERKLSIVEGKIGKASYLMPSGYSVADPYLFTLLNWVPGVGIDLSRWPSLLSYAQKIEKRPATIKALKVARV